MEKISPHISYKEATRSSTAIKKGILNAPSPLQLMAMRRLAMEVFEPLRNHFGVPVYISSFFRSKKLNKIIGGSMSSQHLCLNGAAAMDIDADVFGGCTNKEIFEYIRDHLDYDQLIWEYGTDDNPDWVHVSFKVADNRREMLRAKRIKGLRTVYERMA